MIYDRSHTGSPLLPLQPLHSEPGLVMTPGRGESVTRAHARAAHVGLGPASAAALCRMPLEPVFARPRSPDTGARPPSLLGLASRILLLWAALSVPQPWAALSWVVSCLDSWLREGGAWEPMLNHTPALRRGVILILRPKSHCLALSQVSPRPTGHVANA
jgi:hypothetical protein